VLLQATDTTATAPWWYIAALAGVFTILGGLISFFSNYFVKDKELERADAARWDNQILDGCLLLLTLLEEPQSNRQASADRSDVSSVLRGLLRPSHRSAG